jgi:phosphotransferase system enzyme I (PtsI)
MTPSEAAAIDRRRILAFATDAGGRTSHTSIVARAMDLPAVVGCGRLSQRVEDGDLVIVDGDSGSVILRPDADTVQRYRELDRRKRRYRALLQADAAMTAVTRDGTPITLLGNIEFPAEVAAVLQNGGVGPTARRWSCSRGGRW